MSSIDGVSLPLLICLWGDRGQVLGPLSTPISASQESLAWNGGGCSSIELAGSCRGSECFGDAHGMGWGHMS